MVLGIVYNPILEQLFTARKGRGAFLNGKPIRVSKVEGNELLILFNLIRVMNDHYNNRPYFYIWMASIVPVHETVPVYEWPL